MSMIYLEVDKATKKVVSACTGHYESSAFDLIECNESEFQYLNALSDIRCIHLADLHLFRKLTSVSAQCRPRKAPGSSQEKRSNKSNPTPKGDSKSPSKSKLTRLEFMKGFAQIR